MALQHVNKLVKTLLSYQTSPNTHYACRAATFEVISSYAFVQERMPTSRLQAPITHCHGRDLPHRVDPQISPFPPRLTHRMNFSDDSSGDARRTIFRRNFDKLVMNVNEHDPEEERKAVFSATFQVTAYDATDEHGGSDHIEEWAGCRDAEVDMDSE